MKSIYCAVVPAFFLLSACSEKPPGCADQETRETAKQMVVDEARKQLGATGDEAGIVAKVFDASTVELSAITEDGYVKEANKQLCRAHIKVLSPGADGLEGDVSYSTQRVVDDKSKFVLSMENVGQLAPALVTPARNILAARKRLGSWAGRLDCGEVGGSRDGPRGPFSAPVVMKITSAGEGQPLQARMERSVPFGQDLAVGLGSETLNGAVGIDSS